MAAQLDGARRRQDDLEVRRAELVREALGVGRSVEQVARAARLEVEEVRRLGGQLDDRRPAS